MIYDNHLVKLPDNTLVFTVEAVTYEEVRQDQKPSWWAESESFPPKVSWQPNGNSPDNKSRAGGRGTLYIFRSTQCGLMNKTGKPSWELTDQLDTLGLWFPSQPGSHAITRGMCARYRPWAATNPINRPSDQRAETGGFDGHYLFADQKTGDVFLSSSCAFGTQNIGKFSYADKSYCDVTVDPNCPFDANRIEPVDNQTTSTDIILRHPAAKASWDAASWGMIQSGSAGGFFRNPIASLSSGRVGVAIRIGNDVKIALTDPPFDYHPFVPLDALPVVATIHDVSPNGVDTALGREIYAAMIASLSLIAYENTSAFPRPTSEKRKLK